MGTTFVAIDDRGFWMDDSLLELWLRLLDGKITAGSNDSSFMPGRVERH